MQGISYYRSRTGRPQNDHCSRQDKVDAGVVRIRSLIAMLCNPQELYVIVIANWPVYARENLFDLRTCERVFMPSR
jgi:hypothetical protein